MTPEQERTLAIYAAEWEHQRWRMKNGLVQTEAAHDAFTAAFTNYHEYRVYLDTYVLSDRAA